MSTSWIITDAKTGQNFICHDDEIILKAAEAVGLSYNYATRAGADDTVIAKVLAGRCNNDDDTFIDQRAKDDGWILIDTAYPLSNCTIIFEAYKEWDLYVTYRDQIGYPM